MVREVHITDARANLAREAYYNNKSLAMGFPLAEVLAAMRRLPMLTNENYSPKLDESSDERCCWLFFFTSYSPIQDLKKFWMRIRIKGVKFCGLGSGSRSLFLPKISVYLHQKSKKRTLAQIKMQIRILNHAFWAFILTILLKLLICIHETCGSGYSEFESGFGMLSRIRNTAEGIFLDIFVIKNNQQ